MTNKAQQLAEIEGFETFEELCEANGYDSVVPGICMKPDCNGTAEVEPDQREGWCEACGGNTVKSCIEMLLEIA